MKTLVALATMALALIPSATAGAAMVGTKTVYAPRTNNTKAIAQAYRFTAQSSGTMDRLNVYLDASSTASQVEVGLYSGSGSSASALRARCVISSPRPNTWNSCSVTAYPLTSGAYYWLALVQPSASTGTLQYREGLLSGGPKTYLDKLKNLSSLPASWANGAGWTGGYQASIYADQAGTATTSQTATATPTPTPLVADSDGDGVPDSSDQCPGTPAGTPVDANGCSTTSASPTPTPTPTATPTPSPTPSPPSSGAFPDASNTGVPDGTVLHSCSSTITVSGNYDACQFNGDVWVRASKVTITRSLIKGRVDAGSARSGEQTGLVIRDSEIDCGCPSVGASDTPTAIMESNYTLTRVEIHNSGHGAAVADNVVIEDSWIHGLGGNTDAHKDGIFSGNGSNVTIRHNNIECNDGPLAGCTSAIGLLTDFGDITYYTIDNNLLNTIGSYCFYGEGGPQKPYSSNHITFTNNHFGRKLYPRCGFYGPVTYFDSTAPGNVWSGNVWDDTGASVPAEY